MDGVVEIFDIDQVEHIYREMPKLNPYPPDELKRQFVTNYLIRENEGIDPIRLNIILKSYSDHTMGVRYLIDRDDPLITEVYNACSSHSR